MKKQILFLCFFLMSSWQILAQQIDQAQSKISFEVSNMGVRTVEGTITGMTGTVTFDKNDLTNSSFKVSLDVSTINTDNNARDKHLKNEDFFEVNTYPTMSFNSTQIVRDGSSYKAKGYLKIKDIIKEVEIPFSVSESEGQTTLTGDITIQRKDYHVGMDTGKFMVGYDIEVKISCVVK